MSQEEFLRAPLDVTHVLYDENSHVSLIFALLSLSPVLLMPAYAVLTVYTREFLIFIMWMGQLFSEVVNWLVKHAIQQERPVESIGQGYAFPSSHSQYMGYFSAFLMMHLYFKHRFTSAGSWFIDHLFRIFLYLALASWTGFVCYSRYYLSYHTVPQILWGLWIGISLGLSTYCLVELYPSRYPDSWLGYLKRCLLDSRLAQFARLRDGWAVWADGGREEEWLRWRVQWERMHGRRWKEHIVGKNAKAKTHTH